MATCRHFFRLGLLLTAVLIFCCLDCQAQKAERVKCQVLGYAKHDVSSYTQGLFFYGGKLYESAGQYGESSMRIVDLESGKVLKRKNFSRQYFIEGSCVAAGKLFVLTWREGICFVLDPETLTELGQYRYRGEGWGLTTDGKHLIMSDGTPKIYFRNPKSFQMEKEITVKLDGKELGYLNELEYIDGEIWANIYGSDYIARIDPASGRIKALIDCRNVLANELRKPSTDVLNGIALDPATGHIYITGKNWPRIFRIK